MQRRKHYQDIMKLADDNEIAIFTKIENCFLGYDKEKCKFCIVYFVKQNGEYVINPNLGIKHYRNREFAQSAFCRVLKETL